MHRLNDAGWRHSVLRPFTFINSVEHRMDRFQEVQVFVRVADLCSFSQAARDLLMPRTTVTNLIKRMETRLGARLLERTTRQVRLTPDGQVYLQRCVRLLADLEEAESAF